MKIKDIVNRDLVTLTNCEQEPIHIPGSIQPHGFLLGLSANNFTIEYCSGNTAHFIQQPHTALLGQSFAHVFGQEAFNQVSNHLNKTASGRILPLDMVLGGKPFLCLIHLSNGVYVVDAEPVEVTTETLPDAYQQTEQFLHYMQQTSSLQQLCASVAKGTREITGYDRVMIYRFDEDYNGEVFAESKSEGIEPFLGLFYPHTDIPVQARALYMRNIVRVLSDINYVPVPIFTIDDGTSKNLDLSLSMLRSTSPIHVEYLRNMGVGATLTVSLIHNDRLWGLIACHHYSAKNIPHSLRVAAQLQGHFITSQINVRESNEEYEVSRKANDALENLLAKNIQLTYNAFPGIVGDENLLALCNATGVCVSVNGQLYKGAKTPGDIQIQSLITWLSAGYKNTGFYTNNLSTDYGDAENICDTAAGIVYHSLSLVNNDCIIWFRAETLTEINWGGDPNKAIVKDENGLHPRNSFKLYKEQVKCKSKPWLKPELNAAANFSHDLQKQLSLLAITEKEEKYRKLTLVLQESNSELENINWISTHDLQEPLRKIQLMASRVLEETEESLTDKTKNWVTKMGNSANRMQTLLKDILAYNKIKQPGQAFTTVDLNETIQAILRELDELIKEKHATISVLPLPTIAAVPFLIKQLFTNLITNALKFSRHDMPQVITISAVAATNHPTVADEVQYHRVSVSDTGIGFSQSYTESMFRIFTRLHSEKDLEGSGVGLALCRKIMQMHNGYITATGAINEGAVFMLHFPANVKDK